MCVSVENMAIPNCACADSISDNFRLVRLQLWTKIAHVPVLYPDNSMVVIWLYFELEICMCKSNIWRSLIRPTACMLILITSIFYNKFSIFGSLFSATSELGFLFNFIIFFGKIFTMYVVSQALVCMNFPAPWPWKLTKYISVQVWQNVTSLLSPILCDGF